MAEAKTVKVRVFVLVNEDGAWSAQGWRGAEKGMLRDFMSEGLDADKIECGYWLTAELPIPHRDQHEPEVAAEVQSDGE